MPSTLPPDTKSPTPRARPSLQPTILYRPTAPRAGGAPPCRPSGGAECPDCDERPRDESPTFWSYLRASLALSAAR